MVMNINFFTEGVKYNILNKNKLREWIGDILKSERKNIEVIDIILCNDVYLYKINKTYLQHNTFTDTITFNYSDDPGIIEGEVYISIDRIRENAKEFGVKLKDELHRVIVHSILHLCGYDDTIKSDKEIMTSAEDKYLSLRPAGL